MKALKTREEYNAAWKRLMNINDLCQEADLLKVIEDYELKKKINRLPRTEYIAKTWKNEKSLYYKNNLGK